MGPLFHIEVPWKVSDEQTLNQDLKDLEKACPRQSEEAHAGINVAGRNINNLRYAGDTTLMAESEEELKSLLMKVKEENEKSGLHSTNEDHGIQSHHFMADRWGNNENSDRLYIFGLQNHCRW